jgi:hypothetical protein
VITPLVQRWREGRESYRPAGEPIATHRYEVAPIADDTTAKRFVLEHHYSGSYPAARFRFGLYRGGALEGVAVFSVPSNPLTFACLPGVPDESIELGRLVLLDRVPANGESWFVARCFEELRREGLVGVVAFSDPVPRTRRDGSLVFPGHLGTIYQASNAAFLGRSKPDTLRLFADGSVLHRRAIAKLRNGERGQRNVVRLLERHGAPMPHRSEDVREWATRWARELTRPIKHAGNLKYAWTLRRRDRRRLVSLPYPKFASSAAALIEAA